MKKKKVVKVFEEAHILLKYISFKTGKDMCDIASEVILEHFKEEKKELDTINKKSE